MTVYTHDDKQELVDYISDGSTQLEANDPMSQTDLDCFYSEVSEKFVIDHEGSIHEFETAEECIDELIKICNEYNLTICL